MADTNQEFDIVTDRCREVFHRKMKDYGNAWRILRTPSLTDQIYIKANRIRSLQTKGVSRVEEGVQTEFEGIINYSVMALIQIQLGVAGEKTNDTEPVTELYDRFIQEARELMTRKNHDYGEAWRNMRIESLTDIILMKLLRIKQIEDNGGITTVSEGIDANYFDIINYAAFALIMMLEKH